MGTIILIITFVTETALAAYCITTRSGQARVKSFVQIGAFATFVILALVSIIQWSFRWYALAVLLLVWAALGAWTLIGNRVEKRDYSAGRTVIQGSAALLLVCISITPALILPQYTLPKPTGEYEVASVSLTYTDESRVETFTNTGEHRKVNVAFWYPQDAGGPYPLIVFSHGAFGLKTGNTSTFINLASNGYVVCAIDHPYHALFTRGADGQMTRIDPSFLQEVLDSNNARYDERTLFETQQKWLDLRTADIHFVLDTILAQIQEPASDAVYQLIDPQAIGLIGHSLGGAASAQVARERSDIDAVIDLDADLLGEYLDYVDDRYVMNDQVYPVPILIVYTDTMVRLMENIQDPNLVVAATHVTATAPQAYETHIVGTNHMSLTDVPLVSPLLVSVINASAPKGGGQAVNSYATIEKMNGMTLTFFDAFVKSQGGFSIAATN